MSRTDEGFLGLLEQLTEAALDGGGWGAFLHGLCERTGSSEATLLVVDPAVARCAGCLSYRPQDRKTGRCELAAAGGCLGTAAARWVASGNLAPDAWTARSLWHKPPAAPWLTMCPLWQHDGLNAFLGLRAAEGADQVRTAELDDILPFLRRAFRLAWRLEGGRRRSAMLTQAIERSVSGILLLEARGRVLFMNRCAREMLDEDDGLSLQGGRLRAMLVPDDEALQRLLEGAAGRMAAGTEEAGGGLLTLPRRSGKLPYCLAAAPVRLDRSPLGCEEAVISVFVSDPTRVFDISPTHLRQLYQLTPKETELALLLAQGETVAASASSLGIAEKTARIHLQGLFRKTRTHRQADLLRVLIGSCGFQRLSSLAVN